MDQQTYQQRIHGLRRRAAQDTTPSVQDTTPCVQDTTPSAQDISNHYRQQLQIEELLGTIKDALAREMNSINYNTYVSRLRALHFRRDTGCLTVEAPSPLIAAQLNGQLAIVLRRTVADLKPKISGVQVHTIVAVPGPPHSWDPDDQETGPPMQIS